MTIYELLNTYYLHDSLVEKILYENNTVELTIDFCFWMQEGYREGDPETGIIHLRFLDVRNMSGPIGNINDYSILETDYHDRCFSLLLMDDFNNTCYELKIISSSETLELHLSQDTR